MPEVSRQALVPYTADEMYRLVADIELYPEFVPWVSHTEIHACEGAQVRASIELKKGPVHESFTTLNTLEPGSGMHLSLEKGPFKHLEGQWRFTQLGDVGCKVELDMDFEFSSRLLAMTVGALFGEMVERLVDAFIKRAPEVYGAR